MPKNPFINSDFNITFDQILLYSEDEFREWCIKVRKEVIRLWDQEDQAPVVGKTEEEIIDEMKLMDSYPVHQFLVTDELTGNKNVIRNTSYLGNAMNNIFVAAMMKVPISYSMDVSKSRSIYDFFYRDDLLERFMTYARRHFKRDSFYEHSWTIKPFDTKWTNILPTTRTGIEWITKFEDNNYRQWSEYDYWLSPKEDDEVGYTGYAEHLKDATFLLISHEEYKNNLPFIPEHCCTNIKEDKPFYQIRVYKKGSKLFPIGFKAWKNSFCQFPAQFPPLTAKYLYERYIDSEDKNVIIWDPSMGWGGRLLGFLSSRFKSCESALYLGTDPNTENTKKYQKVYDLYTNNVGDDSLFPREHHKMKYWCLGSEVIQNDPEFQKYKGQVSFVFTSPPYFNREAYVEEDTQSYKKFPQYELWKKGFLYETLKTGVEWLRPNGYLAWNVASPKYEDGHLTFEEDSCKILEELGMKHIETLYMALGNMPGSNRIDTETGLPKTKNYCKVNGKLLKQEPIFIYQKA